MTTKIKAGVIGDGVVGTTQIADDAVTGAKPPAQSSITTSVTSSPNSGDLEDGENFKVNGGQGTDGQLLTSTGNR